MRQELVEPCACIATLFVDADIPGCSAYCDRHKLFALKKHSGSVIASLKPFPRDGARALAAAPIPAIAPIDTRE